MKLLISGFIIFAALITSAPVAVHSQSKSATGGCAPQQRKEIEIAKRVRAYYVIGYCGEFEGRIEIEITDPEIRKTKPVLAYRRHVSQ